MEISNFVRVNYTFENKVSDSKYKDAYYIFLFDETVTYLFHYLLNI